MSRNETNKRGNCFDKIFANKADLCREKANLDCWKNVIASRHLPDILDLTENKIVYKFLSSYRPIKELSNKIICRVAGSALMEINSKRRIVASKDEAERILFKIVKQGFSCCQKGRFRKSIFFKLSKAIFKLNLDLKKTIVHGDFRLTNILYSQKEDNWVLIDFENGCRSDPNWDYGQFLIDVLLHRISAYESIAETIQKMRDFCAKKSMLFEIFYLLCIINAYPFDKRACEYINWLEKLLVRFDSDSTELCLHP